MTVLIGLRGGGVRRHMCSPSTAWVPNMLHVLLGQLASTVILLSVHMQKKIVEAEYCSGSLRLLQREVHFQYGQPGVLSSQAADVGN